MTSFDTKLIQISISSRINSDFLCEITTVLVKYDAIILDLKQVKVNNEVLISIICELSIKTILPIKEAFKDLDSRLEITANFYPIKEIEYQELIDKEINTEYILTVVGKRINTKQLAEVSRILNSNNFNTISTQRLSLAQSLRETKGENVAYEIRVMPTTTFDDQLLRTQFKELATTGLDFSFQKDNIYRKNRRLICFDMDSTLIQTEVIDELAVRAGVGDEVKAITSSAMRGEIDFKESFAKRVSLLKGLDESVMVDIAQNLPFTKGLDRLMRTLKIAGYKTAILSGGFTYFANHIKNRYNIDYIYANNLEIVNGKLTGHFLGEVVDATRKVELLKELAKKEGISTEQTIVIGDGANDLPMILEAGLGVAFHAKPKVQREAPNLINSVGLDGILYYLGFNDLEIKNAQ